jgi:hypothetical protein
MAGGQDQDRRKKNDNLEKQIALAFHPKLLRPQPLLFAVFGFSDSLF